MQILHHKASVVSQILSACVNTHSNKNLLCHQCWRVKPNKREKKRIRGYLPEGITLLKHKQGSVRLYWWKKEIHYISFSSLAFYSLLSITVSGVKAVVFFPAGSGFILIKTGGDVYSGQGVTHWRSVGNSDNSWTKLKASASTVGLKKPYYVFFDECISIVKMEVSSKVIGSERLPLPKLLNKKRVLCAITGIFFYPYASKSNLTFTSAEMFHLFWPKPITIIITVTFLLPLRCF